MGSKKIVRSVFAISPNSRKNAGFCGFSDKNRRNQDFCIFSSLNETRCYNNDLERRKYWKSEFWGLVQILKNAKIFAFFQFFVWHISFFTEICKWYDIHAVVSFWQHTIFYIFKEKNWDTSKFENFIKNCRILQIYIFEFFF